METNMRTRASTAFFVLALAPISMRAQPIGDHSDAVFEAALKGVVAEFLTDDVRANGSVACLQVDPGDAPQSVSKAFLWRFRRLPFVRRGAECEASSMGAYEIATGAPAFILTAGPIEWLSAHEAHVQVGYFRSGRDSGLRMYRVVRERTGWVFLGQIIKMSPA
jgi:hypothetical protein